jgi:hypothetical protein
MLIVTSCRLSTPVKSSLVNWLPWSVLKMPSWNVAPTDPLPVVRYDPRAAERSLDVMRWGLVPFWAKDIKVGFANINAKAEGTRARRRSVKHFSDAGAPKPSLENTIRAARCDVDVTPWPAPISRPTRARTRMPDGKLDDKDDVRPRERT